MESSITLILSSAVVSAIVSSLVSLINNNINNSLKYITSERTKWREKIREVTKIIVCSNNPNELKEALVELEVNLNPHDPKDIEILKIAKEIANEVSNSSNSQNNIDESKTKFTKKISEMLKYDWDRSKRESSFFCRVFDLIVKALKKIFKNICLVIIVILGTLLVTFNLLKDFFYLYGSKNVSILLGIIIILFGIVLCIYNNKSKNK